MGTSSFAGNIFADNLGFCRGASGTRYKPYNYGLWRGNNRRCETQDKTYYDSYEVLSPNKYCLDLSSPIRNLRTKLDQNAFGISVGQFVVCYSENYGNIPGLRWLEDNNTYPRFIQDFNSKVECGWKWQVVLCK